MSSDALSLATPIDEIVKSLAEKLGVDASSEVLTHAINKLKSALILNASQLKTAHGVLTSLQLPLLLEEELLRIGRGQKNALLKISSGVRFRRNWKSNM
jgi:hypothetical protein